MNNNEAKIAIDNDPKYHGNWSIGGPYSDKLSYWIIGKGKRIYRYLHHGLDVPSLALDQDIKQGIDFGEWYRVDDKGVKIVKPADFLSDPKYHGLWGYETNGKNTGWYIIGLGRPQFRFCCGEVEFCTSTSEMIKSRIDSGEYYRVDSTGNRITANAWLWEEKYQGNWMCEAMVKGYYHSINKGVVEYHDPWGTMPPGKAFLEKTFKKEIDSGYRYFCTSTGEKIVNRELAKYAGKWTTDQKLKSFWVISDIGEVFFSLEGVARPDFMFTTVLLGWIASGKMFRYVEPVYATGGIILNPKDDLIAGLKIQNADLRQQLSQSVEGQKRLVAANLEYAINLSRSREDNKLLVTTNEQLSSQLEVAKNSATQWKKTCAWWSNNSNGHMDRADKFEEQLREATTQRNRLNIRIAELERNLDQSYSNTQIVSQELVNAKQSIELTNAYLCTVVNERDTYRYNLMMERSGR